MVLAALTTLPLVLTPTSVAAEQAAQGSDAGQADDAQFRARIERAWQYSTIGEFIRDSQTPPQWFPEGNRFVYWSASGPNAGTWVIVDAQTGRQEPVLAPANLKAQLSALGSKAAIPMDISYQLKPKKNGIFFQIGGQVFALDLASRLITVVPDEDLAAHAVRMPRSASPDDRHFLLGGGGSLRVIDGTRRTIVELSFKEYPWEVEPTSWSPDGRHMLVMRNDHRNTHKIPLVAYDAIEKVNMYPFFKVGTPLPRTEFYIIDLTTGQLKPLPAIEGEGYFWMAGWRPDGREALVLHLSRDGKRLDLIGYDPTTGSSRRIVREERPQSSIAGLDFVVGAWQRQVKPLDDNSGFLWMSERDGWRHAYLYDWSGKLKRQVTSGKYVVQQVLGTAPGGKDVLVVASADGPTPYHRSLYRAPLGGGTMKRVSTQPGSHQISLSPSGRYYTVKYSTLTQPHRSAVAAVEGGPAHQYSEADASRLSTIGYLPPEPFTAKAADGETILQGAILKPWDFDASKRYPIINWVYSGPFTNKVPRSYAAKPITESDLQAHAMAQMGFVVVIVDGRGTIGRSKAFQDVNYGRLGQTEIPDQVTAIRQAAASRPYMDLDRVGIFGHSFGGYYATRGMLTAPDFYKAGYAGAQSAVDEHAMVNEPYLGLMSDNPKGYEAGSNVRLAGNLKGPFKMMHGTRDTNVSISTTMRMADALVKANKHFELLIMPGISHVPTGALDRYYFEDQMKFFIRHLGGPR